MTDKTSVYFASSVGNSRENQEDNALIANGRILSREEVLYISQSRQTYELAYECNLEDNLIIAVSDGMGGHASGEVASAMSVGYLAENCRRIFDPAAITKEALKGEISKLNRYVVESAREREELHGMGATLCGFVRKNGELYGFNVGDSRLYSYRKEGLDQLSVDHTEGQRLLGLGLLSKEECEKFPRRKNLYRYIGYNGELVADAFKIEKSAYTTKLLLCTDGLTDVLSDEEMTEIFKTNQDIKQIGKILIERALGRNAGYGDNITLILIEF